MEELIQRKKNIEVNRDLSSSKVRELNEEISFFTKKFIACIHEITECEKEIKELKAKELRDEYGGDALIDAKFEVFKKRISQYEESECHCEQDDQCVIHNCVFFVYTGSKFYANILWSIALDAKLVDKVIVSSDEEKILELKGLTWEICTKSPLIILE